MGHDREFSDTRQQPSGRQSAGLHSPLEKMRAAESPFPDYYRLPVFPADDAGWRAAIKAR
jgi:hypothetical protein